MNQVQFLYGNKQAYDSLATKNNNTLYFLVDTFEIYKGNDLYTCSYEVAPNATEVEGSPKQNYLYVFTDTAQLAIFNGISYTYLTPAVSAGDIATATGAEANNIPTVGAVQLIIKTLENAISKNAANIASNTQEINNNKAALEILNAGPEVEGSIANITAEAVAEIVGGAEDGFDSLKDIANWITNDTTGAASMANDISDIKKVLGLNNGSSGTTSTSNSIITRVNELETDLEELNKAVIDENNVTSVQYRLTQAEKDIDKLEERPNGVSVNVYDGSTTHSQEPAWIITFGKSDYAGYIDVNGIPIKIVDLTGFASSTKLNDEIARLENYTKNEFTKYYTKTDIANAGFATTTQLNTQIASVNEKFNAYYTTDEADAKFLTADALEPYALKKDVSTIANAVTIQAINNLKTSGTYLTADEAFDKHNALRTELKEYTDLKVAEVNTGGSSSGGTNATWDVIS